jgi:hypothetical protein
VIVESSPCKLYLDLEFNKDANPGEDGEEAVSLLSQLLLEAMAEKCGFCCKMDNLLDLDSSSATKFSRHVILDEPGVLFADNYQVGAFVDGFLNSVSEDHRDKLSFKDARGERVMLVDRGVYTKNRNFRLFRSTKCGKTADLRLSARTAQALDDSKDEEVFLRSMVAWFADEKPDEKTLIVMNGAKMSMSKSRLRRRSGGRRPNGSFCSPFPDIDSFIASVVSARSPEGRIRSVRWRISALSIEYDTAGDRHCRRLQQRHRSNNVRYVALPARGVYFQQCLDPDCAGYNSPEEPLPCGPMPWAKDFPYGLPNDLDLRKMSSGPSKNHLLYWMYFRLSCYTSV